MLVLGFWVGYILCIRTWENKQNVLPQPYRDWFITKEMYLDVDNDDQEERLVAITDKLESSSSSAKVLILQNKHFGKKFLEVPESGVSIIWWQGGDFNKNGKMELAVQYNNNRSGGYLPWYLCEWEGQNFQVILQKEEPLSELIIHGVNDNFFVEIQHVFQRETGMGSETFEWDDTKEEYILSDSF